MSRLVIVAYGVPETQGSVKGYVRGGRAVLTSDNAKLRPWRDTVTWAARDAVGAFGWQQVAGAVRVGVTFWLPRPTSAPKTRDVLPVHGKDADKLLRSILDSLTNAGVWVDDAQVCAGEFTKRYVVGPHLPKIYRPGFHSLAPGVTVTVEEME
jgi:Holliday junction resolvase RusA-like endonuclease